MAGSNQRHCLLLDSGNKALAEGIMQSPLSGDTLLIQVLGDKEDLVAEHEILHIITDGAGDASLRCRLLQQRGERIQLEKLEELAPGFRRNLRVPVQFNSFIYPVTGKWKGRHEIRSIDLSCGGIGFFANCRLEIGEVLEVVIPMTEQPVIVRCEILRSEELRNDRVMYAAKFVNMCNDEEFMVRKAVFAIQLQGDPYGTVIDTDKGIGEAAK